MYEKNIWEDYSTLINAEKLNRIEEQIALLSKNVNNHIYITNNKELVLNSGEFTTIEKIFISSNEDIVCNMNLVINAEFAGAAHIEILKLENYGDRVFEIETNTYVDEDNNSSSNNLISILNKPLRVTKGLNTFVIVANSEHCDLDDITIPKGGFDLVIENVGNALVLGSQIPDIEAKDFEYNSDFVKIERDKIELNTEYILPASNKKDFGTGVYYEVNTDALDSLSAVYGLKMSLKEA